MTVLVCLSLVFMALPYVGEDPHSPGEESWAMLGIPALTLCYDLDEIPKLPLLRDQCACIAESLPLLNISAIMYPFACPQDLIR